MSIIQKIITKTKKNDGYVAVETILIASIIIALGVFILIKTQDSGQGTADIVYKSLSHDSSFINESTKNDIIN